jgi:beta-mannosidase
LKRIKSLAAFTLLLLLVQSVYSQSPAPANAAAKTEIFLHEGWKFHQAGSVDWHAAIVPGCVHTDLLRNKMIEDPFYRDNEKKLQWIGKTDWEYETTFDVAPELLKREKIDLVFDGLDTYAEIFLNDTRLLNTNNMFRTWRVSCKSVLRRGANILRIKFRSPIKEILPLMAKLGYELPASNDAGEKTSPYTRKAPYQYGWDWGPRLVTSGIWKPVSFEAWNAARVNDLHIVQKQVDASAASLTAEVEIISAANVDATVFIDDLTDKTVAARQVVKLKPGSNLTSLDFVISHPSLWWPNGLGAHPLYNFRARVIVAGSLTDQKQTRTGLRSLRLRQETDEWGKSFEFIVNGVPVFAKGGNWIPADSFPTRITEEKYRELLQSVHDANMNMVRVWGGGIYESNDFYDLCDELGILVWQDFMFACSMYPGDQEFLDNVRQEAIDNVKRLRNHPSIAIWVGNNEVETAWLHWGWKDHLPSKVWDDYKQIFHGVLPEVCSTYDPSRPYWPSSPSANLEADPESQRIGDSHYWGVWHAALPFADYEKQFPRFMSEYGFQSFPEIETINSYTLPDERKLDSPVMLLHQKNPRGNQLIREYLLREYPPPKDFAAFLYVSQVIQAEGIKIGAEHLRRIRPRNMGSLYWQIDDCWPVASWSSIDYLGRWKALHYYARRFYSDVLLSPHEENGQIDFSVVSDWTRVTRARLNISLMDFEGHTLTSMGREVEVAALQSRSYFSVSESDLLRGRDRSKVFVYCELLVEGKPVSSNEIFFQPYKDLAVSKAQISTSITRIRGGFKIALKTERFAKAVYLSVENEAGRFSDNYFDLIPGRTVEVEFRAHDLITLNDFRRRLKVRSLADAF